MTVTRAQLLATLQRRLCDTAAAIWPSAELEGYIQEGYDDLTKRTGCLFDTAMLPDAAFAFSFVGEWEAVYVPAGGRADGPAQFTSSFERDFIDNARGPANHNHTWEFNAGHQTITEVDALADLPGALQEIERATWNTRRIAALRSRDLETWDSRYELNKGEVDGYTQDKDGLGILRKWRVPSSAYGPYSFDAGLDLFCFSFTGASWEGDYLPTGAESNGPHQFSSGGDIAFAGTSDTGPADHNYLWEAAQGYVALQTPNDDGFGIIRSLSGILDINVQSEGFGDLIQVDTVNVFEDFGIMGPIYPDTHVMRIEYRRRGATLSDDQPFEIADRYTVYVRHFAQALALEREGPGQDVVLAGHFRTRYQAGIERLLRRKQAMSYQRAMVMGGGRSIRSDRLPLARLPHEYGRRVR